MRTISLLLLTTLIHGCASFATPEPDLQDIYPVQILYATDRAPQKAEAGGLDYSGKRGRKIYYGIANINVWPIEHEEKNADGKVRKIISRPIASEFDEASNLGRERFLRQLQAPAQNGKGDEVLLFVHGFKRNFRAAAEHAALIGEGIGFGGRTLLWSWPSLDSPAGYLTDRTTLLWSQRHLARFVSELIEKGQVRRLVLVAHSLGAQALTQALFEQIGADKLAEWDAIERLVLLAPDIDLGIFRRDIVPAINQVGIPTTVYASSTDLALMTSSSLNGYPRAGDSSNKVFIFPGIDTIDATQVTQSFLGHSYYRRSYAVIDDLHLMIVRNLVADDRPGLVRRYEDGKLYWKLE